MCNFAWWLYCSNSAERSNHKRIHKLLNRNEVQLSYKVEYDYCNCQGILIKVLISEVQYLTYLMHAGWTKCYPNCMTNINNIAASCGASCQFSVVILPSHRGRSRRQGGGKHSLNAFHSCDSPPWQPLSPYVEFMVTTVVVSRPPLWGKKRHAHCKDRYEHGSCSLPSTDLTIIFRTS